MNILANDKLNSFLNKLEKSNLLYLLTIFFALINVLTVFIFKNTAIRNTYDLRVLMLVAMIIALIATLTDITLLIVRFIKNKQDKTKFIIKLVVIVIATTLLSYSFAKYFLDNNIYYYHINQTNIIFLCGLACAIIYLILKNLEDTKKNIFGIALLFVIILSSLIVMIVNIRERNVNVINIAMLLGEVAALFICCLSQNKREKKVFGFVITFLGGLLLFATFVTTCISRTVFDVLNMVNFLLCFSSILILCNIIFNIQENENIIQLVLKCCAVVLFLTSLIKLIEKDNAVLEYLDVTRLIMFAGFILLSLVNIKEFKSYITIIYIVTCTAIGLTGLLVLAINRFQNQMDAYYITIAIFLMIAILLPIGYSILINKKKDITIEDKNN